MQKKKWKKPELIVLVRLKPEEAVLQVCKGDNVATSNADKFDKCSYTQGKSQCNKDCDTISAT